MTRRLSRSLKSPPFQAPDDRMVKKDKKVEL